MTRHHVRIHQGTPYHVPEGRLLTLKALSTDGSTTDSNNLARVEVDGRGVGLLSSFDLGPGVTEIPFGITVGGGRTVDVVPTPNTSPGAAPLVVYGYLSKD